MQANVAVVFLAIASGTCGTTFCQSESTRSFATGLEASGKTTTQTDSLLLKQADQRTGVSTPPAAGTAFGPAEVVAIVGDEPILVGDMLLEINQILDQHLKGAPPDVLERERRNLIRALSEKFVNEKLLYQDGVAGLPDGVDVEAILKQAEKEFDETALPKIMKQSKIDSATAFDAHLRALGSSLRQFRRSWAKEQLAGHLVRQKLDVNEDISHAELLENYHEHIDDFKHLARARWEELMVRFDRFPTRQAAEQKILEIGDQVVYGASFQAVAKESSNGFSAMNGGQFDWTTQGSLVSKKVEDAVFELPLNYLSDVIESETGFHIIRVLEREEAFTTPFRDAQPEIREKLMEARRRAAIQSHIESLRKKIPHEIVFQ